MQKLNVGLLLAATITLSGCAGMQERAAANQASLNATRAEFEATRPVCRGEAQCQAAWAAARNWVINTCGMKIQNITDGYIETYGSTNMALSCRVTKDPQADGSWMLTVATGCGNPFGCSPDVWPSALNFNATVNAAIPKDSPTGGYLDGLLAPKPE